MTSSVLRAGVIAAVLFVLTASCGSGRKLSEIRSGAVSATLRIPGEHELDTMDFGVESESVRDTLTVKDLDGREMLIMRAIKDEETGDMVATEQINAAVVTSRFRNVAERHGKVNLEFQVIVPAEMQDSKWQLRFYPVLYMLGDSVNLDRVVITGKDYRAAQLRGYQQYERFLSRIVTDTAKFVMAHQLEVFLERNLPQIYAFKTDSSYVSDEEFLSHYGVSERQAIDHYTNWLAVNINTRRKGRLGKVWDRYVKAPIETDHIRLDTVMRNQAGDFVYNYVQTVSTRPGLRRADLVLSGDIWEQDRKLYDMPTSDSLTFYISSLSSFVDPSERFLTKVIERRMEAESVWKIDFPSGKSDIDPGFAGNARELSNMEMTVRRLLADSVFEMDSVTVSASASPEGSLKMNDVLSCRRAASVSGYFREITTTIIDSLRREAGMTIVIGEDVPETGMMPAAEYGGIPFRSMSAGENWPMLDAIVEADTLMSPAEKERYRELSSIRDFDRREAAMRTEKWYPRMRAEIYPRLRTVQFRFYMHRRGMVKDTVHTTELDTTYMRGVEALRERDYETALALLAAYEDYNTAIAYVSLDRNASAMSILKNCPRSAMVNYMLAVLYSRMGDDRSAVECYLQSCAQEPSYVHRGNLDPEISQLKNKYKL